jgi:hypothetical protein
VQQFPHGNEQRLKLWPIIAMIEVVEIPTTDLLLSFVESYRLAYRDEIDQKNEIGINPFLGGDPVADGNTGSVAEGNICFFKPLRHGRPQTLP